MRRERLDAPPVPRGSHLHLADDDPSLDGDGLDLLAALRLRDQPLRQCRFSLRGMARSQSRGGSGVRACLGCGKPVANGGRCPGCKRRNAQRRKDQGLTGERGSTHASRERRRRVLARANHRCFYCSAPADVADHYQPLAAGGSDAEDNLVAACQPCNSKKGDQAPAEFTASAWLARRCEEVAEHYASSKGGAGGRGQNVA